MTRTSREPMLACTRMNIAHIWIIAAVSVVGMAFLTQSLWKGLCYTVWVAAALAFWWAMGVTLF